MRRIHRRLGLGAFLVCVVVTGAAQTAQAQLGPGVDPLAYQRRYTGELPVVDDPQAYSRFNWHHGKTGWWHGVKYIFQDGVHHGFPYGHSEYEPRFPGMSYTFERWAPIRSYYYPAEPGRKGPYGYAPEPYYGHGY
jgi:hypothetical protein